MNAGLIRTLALVLSFVLGACVPQAHVLSWLIRWLIMGMLFVVFLRTRLSRDALHRSHLWLFAANLAMSFAGYGLGWVLGGREVALAIFFAGIAPTATAAPVVTSFLRGQVDYVVAAFLLSNIGVALLMPTLLPHVLGHPTPEACAQVAGTMALVVFAPMAAGWLVRTLHPQAADWPVKLRNVSFGAWVLALFLVTANAADFLRSQATVPHDTLALIASLSLLVCAANFGLGRVIGGTEHPREASQALGQKNTTFTIYLALTYANPLVALGPSFYVLWHNLWNSWQLHQASRRRDPPP